MMNRRTYLTTGERVRDYLAIAFALSLLLSALSSTLYPDINVHHDDSPPQPSTITHIDRIARVQPTPTPPPPSPRPQSRPMRKARPFAARLPHIRTAVPSVVARPRVAAPMSNAGEIPGVETTDAPGPPATVSATPAPACANPNAEAHVIDTVAPEYPDSARDLQLGDVTVMVEVTLGLQGQVIDAKVTQSSNDAAIDQAALRSARESTYAPKIVGCSPVSGSYLFRADFSAQ
jgi:TonB family protein